MVLPRILIVSCVTAAFLVVAVQSGWLGGSPNLDEKTGQLLTRAQQLTPIHQTMGPVQSGDWLQSHSEPGQTFPQYVAARPVKLTEKRNVLYVLPLGEFNPHQQKIIKLSADFLGLYFACQVTTLETISLDQARIPQSARRVHPSWGVRQVLSTHVLDQVLKPRIPGNGVALIAFTSSDLYPADDWNFVFGQASLRDRVGVWSIFRNGDPETEFGKCLLRTLKTATHETGHMFSIRHCTAFECNMCGSNNRGESDRRPIWMCPNCVAKVWYATDCDPVKRFERLSEFCATQELEKEAEFYKASAELLKSKSK